MAERHQTKRRATDRRREKSRVAARFRRNKESEIFNGLISELPREYSTPFNSGQLDKATIMRLTLSTMKFDKILHDAALEKESAFDSFCLDASDGFLIVLASDSEIIYVTRNVVVQLGLPHVDFIGHSLFQFTHPCETQKLQRLLDDRRKLPVDLCFRIKSQCAVKRNANATSSFEVVHCRSSSLKLQGKTASALMLLCHVLPEAGAIYDLLSSSVQNKTFVTRHRMNMKMIDCDKHIDDLLGYQRDELVDRSLFEFCHAADIETIGRSFKQLFALGKIKTEPYRLLANSGGYVWVTTMACVCYEKVTGDAYGVKCFHEIISSLQEEEEIIALSQAPKLPEKPVFKTESVFCPLNEITEAEVRCRDFDVNSEALVNLAPHAGESCVPLEIVLPELSATDKQIVDLYEETINFSSNVSQPLDQVLTIQIDDMETESAPLSPDYPPSEGFTAESPELSPYPYGSPAPSWTDYNRFSPLPRHDLAPGETPDWESMFDQCEPTLEPCLTYESTLDWEDNFQFDVNRCKPASLCSPLKPIPPPARVEPAKPKNDYSALMSLLLAGSDRNYADSTTALGRLGLPIVTTQDAEVNVPIQQMGLLTGQQLLDALEDSNSYG